MSWHECAENHASERHFCSAIRNAILFLDDFDLSMVRIEIAYTGWV